MAKSQGDRGAKAIIPTDWRKHPELLPALRVWVEGARRALEERCDKEPT